MLATYPTHLTFLDLVVRQMFCEDYKCNVPTHGIFSITTSMALQPCAPWPLFQFLNLNTVSSTQWMGDNPFARPLPTHRTTQTQIKRTQTSMPWVGFEHTFPAIERAKTVHALSRAATVFSQTLHTVRVKGTSISHNGCRLWSKKLRKGTMRCILRMDSWVHVFALTFTGFRILFRVRGKRTNQSTC
jgi:hypothetical protein